MEKPLRTLIIEDSADDVALLVRELRRNGYDPTFERVDTAQAMTAALAKQAWDVIICDYNLPNFSAPAALTLLQASGLDLPVIIVSGSVGEDIAVAAMKTGAHDYIMKGNLTRLIPAIERELREAEMRQSHAQAEKMIQHMAFYDTLTDLPNRNMLYDRLLNAIRTDAGKGKPSALLLVNLNHFKEINDTLGHDRGDQILQQVGRRVREVIFEQDIVARLGGDEFGILLLNMANAKDIDVAIQKILKALDPPFLIEDLPIRVEAGIGIALYPDHGRAAEILFRRADIALHASKQAGISYTVYDPAQDKHSPQRLALMGELHHAIEHGELLLFYQPKISLKTRRVIGVEALVRWKHPHRGMIPPDQFILPAEQTGLIHPLTHWVLAAGMRECKAWHESGTALTVSVNLSARNLLDPKLPDQVAEQLHSAEAAPDWMTFEITESTIMANPAHALDVLMRLHEMGIRFSIDDFGIGYSSLAYLKKLPVDAIKIDKSFVINMAGDQSDAVIVRSTIDLAHNLGLKVIAEGVENQDIWDRLSALGCDEAQGYYMGRPIPPEELTRWFDESPWGFKGPGGKKDSKAA